MDAVSLGYLPIALGLGALHALEPGHAKTMTAAYLLGIRGDWRDAVLLGLAAAATHSLVVIAIAVAAVLIGRQAFAGEAVWWLQIGSGVLVVLIGGWMLGRRLLRRRADHAEHHEHHEHEHHEHEHHDEDDDEHARQHAAAMPAYVGTDQRPTRWQVVLFGAAGGLVPCPASISVMLLAITLGTPANGLVLVAGFSLGLAIALVSVGVLVILGVQALAGRGRMAWFSRHSSVISAAVVVLSGLAAIAVGLRSGGH